MDLTSILKQVQYSPGGDGFQFDSDNLLHDTDGVLNSAVDICLVSLTQHSTSLLAIGLLIEINRAAVQGET